MTDDAHLDGCDLDFDDRATNTDDADIDALALFADVDFTDPAAVERRRSEWMELLA